jgi:hypothetical protein
VTNSPLSTAEQMAKNGYKVLLIQCNPKQDDENAYLQERFVTPNGMRIGILSISPLPLSLPKYSRYIDRQAANVDGSFIFNLRGRDEFKKRLFLAFSVALKEEYNAIVIDCRFGEAFPYNTNPGNLGYAFLAATVMYAGLGIKQFIIAGEIHTDYCTRLVQTMAPSIKFE